MSPRRKPTAPGVEIVLDRPRRLVYDFNALAAIEETLGINALDPALWEDAALMTATRLRAVLWAGLLADDPDLTIEAVGAMLTPDRIETATEALTAALAASYPDGGEDADPDRPPEARRRRPTG